MQQIPFRHEPALGEKFAGARPESGVAVHGVVHGPDVHSLQVQMPGGGVGEGQVGRTGADDGSRREEAEGLAQDGRGVRKGVEEVRDPCDAGGTGEDGSKDPGVLGTESGQGLRVA